MSTNKNKITKHQEPSESAAIGSNVPVNVNPATNAAKPVAAPQPKPSNVIETHTSAANNTMTAVQYSHHSRVFAMYLALLTDVGSIQKALVDMMMQQEHDSVGKVVEEQQKLSSDEKDLGVIKQKVELHMKRRSMPDNSMKFYRVIHDLLEVALKRMTRICDLLENYRNNQASSTTTKSVAVTTTNTSESITPHRNKIKRVREYAIQMLAKVLTHFHSLEQHAQAYQKVTAAWGANLYNPQPNVNVMNANPLSRGKVQYPNQNTLQNGNVVVKPRESKRRQQQPKTNSSVVNNNKRDNLRADNSNQKMKDGHPKIKKEDKKETSLISKGNEKGQTKEERYSSLLADPTTAPLQILPSNNQFEATSSYSQIFNPLLTLPTFEPQMYGKFILLVSTCIHHISNV